MPANVGTPFFSSGDISFRASAAVLGMRFIAPSGNRTGGPGLTTDYASHYVCATCPAGARPCGVSKYDVPAGGDGGMHGQPGKVVPVVSGALIAAGAEVQSDANGNAIPLGAGRSAGICMTGVLNIGDVAEVKLV